MLNRIAFQELLDEVRTRSGTTYVDPETVYGDLLRLVAGILVTYPKGELAGIYGAVGWKGQPNVRPQAFLRALATLPNFDIIYGHFLTNETYMPQARVPPGAPPKYVRVIKTEEKGRT